MKKTDFDLETSKAKCQCKVKADVISDSKKVKFSPNKIVENFYKVEKYSNIKIIICYHQVFNLERLKKNSGSYITLFVGSLFLIIMFINFITINTNIRIMISNLFFAFKSINKKMNLIEKEKKMEKENDKNNKYKNIKKESIDASKESQISLKINNFKESKIKHNKIKNNNKKFKKGPISNPRKKRVSQKKLIKNKKEENKINTNKRIENKKYSKKTEKIKISSIYSNNNSINSINDKILINSGKSKIRNKTKNKIKKNKYHSKETFDKKKNDINIYDKIIDLITKKERMNYFNDDELNSLDFKIALKIDIRTYCQFYYSLLRQNHLIIFTFFVKNDYNLFLLKLSLFLISFSLFCFMNAIFFDDDSLHKIYEDEGKYDILYQIPKILYSTFFSKVIGLLLEKLSLSKMKY